MTGSLRQKRALEAPSPDLFDAPAYPDGFSYQPELFSAADETDYVARFQGLPFRPFEFHGYLGNRRIVAYGYQYDYGRRVLRQAEPIPDFLVPLLEVAARFTRLAPSRLQQALVTEYAPGAGIGWHRDKPMFEDVVALSFLAPCVLRLRRREPQGWARFSVPIQPRSGYVLRGPVRDIWEHSIAPMTVTRYSVTFRSFRLSHEDRT